MVKQRHSAAPQWWRRLKAWWATDCEACRRGRLILLWALLMVPLLVWWLSQ